MERPTPLMMILDAGAAVVALIECSWAGISCRSAVLAARYVPVTTVWRYHFRHLKAWNNENIVDANKELKRRLQAEYCRHRLASGLNVDARSSMNGVSK